MHTNVFVTEYLIQQAWISETQTMFLILEFQVGTYIQVMVFNLNVQVGTRKITKHTRIWILGSCDITVLHCCTMISLVYLWYSKMFYDVITNTMISYSLWYHSSHIVSLFYMWYHNLYSDITLSHAHTSQDIGVYITTVTSWYHNPNYSDFIVLWFQTITHVISY